MEEGRQIARKRVRNTNHDQMDSNYDRLTSLPEPIIHHILSLMDTKYAERTCVLSKKWTSQWTQIHSLDFNYESFGIKIKFQKFVCCVLLKRQPFNLRKLRFLDHCYGDSFVAKKIFNYIKSLNVEELETNSAYLHSHLSEIQTLRTLRLFNNARIKDSTHFASLTTLYLSGVQFGYLLDEYSDVFSRCLNLETLLLDRCSMAYQAVFQISAPRIVNLTLSEIRCHHNMKLVVPAPTIKFFDYSGIHVELMLSIDECLALQRVKIHMIPSIAHLQTQERKQEYALDLPRMAERLSHVKSVNISWNFSEENFILDRIILNPDSKPEVFKLNKETKQE